MSSSLDPQFERTLRELCEKTLEADWTIPQPLRDSIEYSLFSGGKRIRPRLALAATRLLQIPIQTGLHLATAIEMVHCSTLIHDDLPSMDNDDLRRGKPSNHKVFGEAIALLAGNSLLLQAAEIFSELISSYPNEVSSRGRREFFTATGSAGVIGGQAAEFDASRESHLENLRELHQKKTGALFRACIWIPALLSGLSSESPKGALLLEFASAFGEAFQVADDLEDSAQDEKVTKPSLPHAQVLSYLSPKQAAGESRKRLNSAIQGLTQTWPHSHHELAEIAHELVQKLGQV